VSEWSIPVANTATAMLRLRDLIKDLHLKVHFSVEVRFTKADDIWLSPSYGRDSAWIGIIMYRPYGRYAPCVCA
jgi:L-gulonolactone oxidase